MSIDLSESTSLSSVTAGISPPFSRCLANVHSLIGNLPEIRRRNGTRITPILPGTSRAKVAIGMKAKPARERTVSASEMEAPFLKNTRFSSLKPRVGCAEKVANPCDHAASLQASSRPAALRMRTALSRKFPERKES